MVLKGVKEPKIENAKQAIRYLMVGESQRHVAGHGMNTRSSRSHTIFTMLISSVAPSGKKLYSKLNLVDLAGSERADKTGVSGAAARESLYINKSLTFLEQVGWALRRRVCSATLLPQQEADSAVQMPSSGRPMKQHCHQCVEGADKAAPVQKTWLRAFFAKPSNSLCFPPGLSVCGQESRSFALVFPDKSAVVPSMRPGDFGPGEEDGRTRPVPLLQAHPLPQGLARRQLQDSTDCQHLEQLRPDQRDHLHLPVCTPYDAGHRGCPCKSRRLQQRPRQPLQARPCDAGRGTPVRLVLPPVVNELKWVSLWMQTPAPPLPVPVLALRAAVLLPVAFGHAGLPRDSDSRCSGPGEGQADGSVPEAGH